MTVTEKDLHKTCHIFYLDQNIASSFLIWILKQEHGDNAKKRWNKRKNLRERVQLRTEEYCDTESMRKSKILNINHKKSFFLHTEIP